MTQLDRQHQIHLTPFRKGSFSPPRETRPIRPIFPDIAWVKNPLRQNPLCPLSREPGFANRWNYFLFEGSWESFWSSLPKFCGNSGKTDLFGNWTEVCDQRQLLRLLMRLMFGNPWNFVEKQCLFHGCIYIGEEEKEADTITKMDLVSKRAIFPVLCLDFWKVSPLWEGGFGRHYREMFWRLCEVLTFCLTTLFLGGLVVDGVEGINLILPGRVYSAPGKTMGNQIGSLHEQKLKSLSFCMSFCQVKHEICKWQETKF